MSRKHRIVHLISFVALVMSLFSPMLTLPATAEDEPATPEVTLSSDDDSSISDPQESINPVDPAPVEGPPSQADAPAQIEAPDEPVTIPVMPAAPVLSDVGCSEGMVYSQTVSPAVTEGVSYVIGAPDATGNFFVTATLTDASVYAWADTGSDGWTVSSDKATWSGNVAHCPAPTPQVELNETVVPEIESIDMPVSNERIGELATPDVADSEQPDSTQHGSHSNQITAYSSNFTLVHSVAPTTAVTPGSQVSYEVSIHTETIQQIGFTITLPADVTYSGVSAQTMTSGGHVAPMDPRCTHNNGVVTCNTAPVHIVDGVTAIWTVNTTVNDSLSAETCTSGLESSATGIWADSPTKYTQVPVTCEPLLNLAVLDTYLESIVPGEEFEFSVQVTNTGSANDASYAFGVTLPEGFTFLSADGYSEDNSCNPSTTADVITITCESLLSPTVNGGVHNYMFRVKAALYPEDGLQCGKNTFTLSGTSGQWAESANTTSATTTVECPDNLAISMSGEYSNGEIVYTIVLTNQGEHDALSRVVNIDLPVGIELLNWTTLVTSSSIPPFSGCSTSSPVLVAGVGHGIECPDLMIPRRSGDTNGTVTITLSAPADLAQCATYTTNAYLYHDMTSRNNYPNPNSGISFTPITIWATAESTSSGSTVTTPCGPSLEISKSPPTQSIDKGNEGTYSVTVTNTGVSAEDAYSFTDILPAGLELAGEPPTGCTEAGSVITCSGANLDVGAANTHTFDVTVTATGDVCGELTITATGIDGQWKEGVTSAVSAINVVCPEPVGELIKTVDKGTAETGDTLVYTINAVNDTSTNQFLDFTDTLPEGVTYVDSNARWYEIAHPTVLEPSTTLACSHTDGVVACNTVNTHGLGMVRGYIVTITVTVDEDASCGQIVNNVSGTRFLEGQSDSASTTIVSNCEPNLTLDIEANKTAVEPGDTITYTVTVTNDGLAAEDYYLFRASIPVGTSIVLDSPVIISSGLNCAPIDEATRLVSCSSTNVQPKAIHSISYSLQVTTAIHSYICEGLQTSLTEQDGQWNEDNPSTHDISIRCPELHMTVADNIPEGESIGLNEPFKYTITVTNTGDSAIGDFSFSNILPDGIVLHGDQDARCELDTRYENRAVWCFGTVVPLDDENGVSFDINVMAVDTPIDTDYPGACPYPISYNGVYAAAGIWASDSRYVEERTTVRCVSSFTLTNEPLASAIVPGDSIGFVLTIHNTGNTRITSLVIGDEAFPDLPAGEEWTTTFEVNDTAINWEDFEGLAAGDKLVVRTVSSDVPDDLTLPETEWCKAWTSNATVNGGFTWGADQQTTKSAAVQVQCTGLSIDQHVSETSIKPGDQVTFTITVTNLGNTIVSPLMAFHDSSETGTVFSNWNVTSDTELDCGLVEGVDPGCTYLTLAPQESAVITITADTPMLPTEEQCAPVTSQAVFVYGETLPAARTSTDLTPPYTQVYSDPVTTQLECSSEFSLSNEPLYASVVPGETIGFELTVHNNGTTELTELEIVDDTLPELPEGADWATSYTLNGDPVTSEGLVLAPGDTLVRIIESSPIPTDLTLPDSGWCKAWSTNSTAYGSFSWGNDQESTESATVQVNCTSLSINLDVNAVRIELGTEVTYTITVTNHGNTVIELLSLGDDSITTDVFSNWTAASEDSELCISVDDVVTPTCLFEDVGPGESVEMTITGDAPILPTWKQCAPVENHAWFGYLFAYTPELLTAQTDITPPNTTIYSDPVTTQLDCQPDVSIDKSSEIDAGDNGRVDAGDTITYTINVTNSGNMVLYDIVLTLDLAGSVWEEELTVAELQPGERESFTIQYTITQADLDAGELVSTASVYATLIPVADFTSVQFMGLAPWAEPLPVITDSVTSSVIRTTTFTQEPGIELGVTSDGILLKPGDAISFTFAVTNTGNVTLTDIEILGDMDGLVFTEDNTISRLAPNESATITASYVITESGVIEICAGTVANDPNNAPVNASDDCIMIEIAQPIPVTPTPSPDPVTPEPSVTPDPVTPVPSGTPDTGTPDPAATPGIGTPEPSVTPESSATPTVPATPDSQAEDSQDPLTVTKLPETGAGNIVSIASVLWSAAILGVLALGVGGTGMRRFLK